MEEHSFPFSLIEKKPTNLNFRAFFRLRACAECENLMS